MNLRLATLTLGFIQSPSPHRVRIVNQFVIPNASPLREPSYPKRIKCSSSTSSSSSKLHVSAAATALASNPLAAKGFDFKPALYMALLAIQFACQPILTKKFTPKSVNRSTVIISQDITKIVMGCMALFITNSWKKATIGWNIRSWVTVAIPALLYSVQNFATLVAYQNLAPITFNVLNQTKTLSAALCCYIFMGKVQSKVQIVSLMLLFLSACIIEKLIPLRRSSVVVSSTSSSSSKKIITNEQKSSSNVKETQNKNRSNHVEGVIAVLLASFISGLAGAITQRILQSNSSSSLQLGSAIGSGSASASVGRNTYLFSIELSAASLMFVLISSLRSADGKRIKKKGFFDEWTPRTIIPIITNAAGGIIVGLVTKYSGAVKKGFALIFGLVLSGVLQTIFFSTTSESDDGSGNNNESKLSIEQICGTLLAALSLWMHSSYPVK